MGPSDLINDTVLLMPERMCQPDSWVGHIPFALWLVAETAPRLMVELGTHSGNSYFAFCQAVQAKGLATRCYAIDTWEGDEQAGYYGDVVYQSVKEHNERFYSGFSRLLRMTFDTAVSQFSDGTIDLLHIDGLHTYAAVHHDFETWRSKLSERAVVLFHDSSVRDENFGVWKLWAELAARYPHLHFEHSNGLGVLVVGEQPPPQLLALIETAASSPGREKVGRFFARVGESLRLEVQNTALHEDISGYRRVIEARDVSIADLIRQVNLLQESVNAFRQLAGDRDQRLSALQGEHHQLNNEHSRLQKEHRRLQEEYRRLQEEYRRLQEEHRRLQEERDAVLASRSWRLTRPLREGGIKARQLRDTLRHGIMRSRQRLALGRRLVSLSHHVPMPVRQRAALRSWYYRRRGLAIFQAGTALAPLITVTSPYTAAAMRAARGRRMLVIERSVPRPNQDAGSVMIFNFIRIFRNLGYAVTFFPVDLAYDADYTPALETLGVTCLHPPGVRSLDEHLARVDANYELILTCRPDHTDPLLPLLKRYCPQAKIIFETHDLHFVREQRQAEIENKPELLEHAAWRKAQELRIAATVDCTLVVSDTERQILLRENPALDVEVIPVISEIYGCSAGFEARRDLVFLGGFEHRPNVDAVLFFVQEILPLIVRDKSDIRLHVVGSHPPPEITALTSANVTVHGFVPDLDELMSTVRISVNPLRFGAGVKGKIITSMAYGVPCVGTVLAVEGMALVAGEQALVADDPVDFAREVIRLHGDGELWAQLSQNGLAFARQHFSLEAATETFLGLFSRLLASRTAPEFPLVCVTSGEAYHRLDRGPELARRRVIEAAFVQGQAAIVTRGSCFVCAQEVDFHSDLKYGFPSGDGRIDPNWRERVVCPLCQLNNRTRAAIHLFHLLCSPTLDSRLYLTEQTTPLFAWFQGNYRQVTGSEYLGDRSPLGRTDSAGLRNENLTALSFADGEFDAILSFDVFEHIPDYLQAFRECLRCLKSGGTLFFSVPFDLRSKEHIVRAEVDTSGTIRHILPPEYHGDPLNAGGCLCFYHFGWELLDQLRALGFRDAAAYLYWSRHFGYLGGEQLLFRAVK